MKVRITPHPLSGAGEAVLSKSYAHRYLIAAALSGGSVSYGDSDDAARTARALYALGFDADFADDSVHYGLFHRPTSPVDISVGESGSTLRFLLPLAAALGVNAQFITAGRLSERPMDALAQTLAEHGAVYREQRIEGALTAGKYTIDATVSSQFVTGLLMALPLLEGDSEISLVGRMVSAPYVEITLDVLRASGISIDRRENGFFVHGGQKYRLNGAVVPGDFSGAAFPLTAGALGGPITLMGLDVSTAQGDKAILDVLRLAGAKVSTEEGKITVSRGELRSFTADVGGPVLAAEGGVAFVAAEHDLAAVFNDFAIQDAGVVGGFLAAPADCFDFLDAVRPGQEPLGTFKEVAAEIRPEAIGNDRNIQDIHNPDQQLDLGLGEELGFIDNDAVIIPGDIPGQFFHKNAGRLQAGTGSNDAVAVPRVDPGLDHEGFLAPFFIVILDHDGVGSFGGSHCAVTEKQFSHDCCSFGWLCPELYLRAA